MVVLYGSQTGCAKEVAERIGREAKARAFKVRVKCMEDYNVTELPNEQLVIAVTSTTGQGDAPDNMRSFWSFLLRRSLPPDSLFGTVYAVFGLGDSSYAKYNAVAKRLDRRLEQLGASRVQVPAYARCDMSSSDIEFSGIPRRSALATIKIETAMMKFLTRGWPPFGILFLKSSRSLPGLLWTLLSHFLLRATRSPKQRGHPARPRRPTNYRRMASGTQQDLFWQKLCRMIC